MSTTSAKLTLPYMQAAQAQKHVTHNEALRVLDALVQTGVISKDVNSPPSLPADGDAYVIAAGGTGDWAGQDGNLAVWDDNAWLFYTPNEGWTVWVNDLDTLWSFDGTGWAETAPAESWQNQPMLGINTTADATNRLSVSAPATLLSNEGAGHQLKINKAASGDTASLVFQSNWAGHAEMGLAGETDFSIKTSDGTSWFTALKCASTDGRVSFPSGVSGRIEVFGTGNSVFIGEDAGSNDDLSDNNNVFVGAYAGQENTAGYYGNAVGTYALRYNTMGASNCAFGFAALYNNTTGSNNTAIGGSSLRWTTTGADNIGYSNCAGLGIDTRVSGSNQVQLGNSSTTTYAYGAVQDRSDARDKTDVRDTVLGLDFITRLRPVDFRWDMRDDYFDEVEETDPETGEVVTKLVKVKKDGSRKRGRFHHGVIAQEVAAVLEEAGLDFGGYQDHNYSGSGEDVLSIGYTEFIGPLIRAVQELAAEVAALKAKV